MSAMPQRSIVDRMKGAAMLDVSTYEEVEADRGATGQAFVVVLIVAVCAAIGGIRGGMMGIIIGPIMAVLGWLLWAAVTMFVGTKFFGGTADMGELLRTLGFAQSPGVLLILGFIPIIGPLIGFVVGIWQLVAGVIAIRQALDFDTTKAILTALVGWVIVFVATLIIGGIFGVGAAIGNAF
jgi:hypothetical protein